MALTTLPCATALACDVALNSPLSPKHKQIIKMPGKSSTANHNVELYTVNQFVVQQILQQVGNMLYSKSV
jgi:hypothetical protein